MTAPERIVEVAITLALASPAVLLLMLGIGSLPRRPLAERHVALMTSAAVITMVASLGVALFPSRDVRTKDALLRALEAALLEAKRRGGDRLCVFQQEGFIYTPSGDDKL